MPISAADFVGYYPRLYHMAEAGVWPAIREHGLLSTSALLDLYEIVGDLRQRIEGRHRPESVEIAHPRIGRAVIRDQKPMREGALRQCLRGMTAEQWYRALNGRVFFWVTPDRVRTLLNAKAYRDRQHTVITVDTAPLLAEYADRMFLSPINSGSTIYNPQPRGVETFRSLADYQFEERRRLRGVGNAVAEAAIIYSVPNLAAYTLRVEHRMGDRVLDAVYVADSNGRRNS